VHNSVYNGKKRHIRIRHGAGNIIAEAWCYLLGVCEIHQKLADPLTKGLPRKVVLELSRGMGLKPME